MKNFMINDVFEKRRALSFAAMLVLVSNSLATIIPANRITTWQGNVGVEGGIPNSSNMTIYATVTVAQGGGAINTALANCPSNQVVQLQTGTYTISSLLNFVRNGVVLRGAGPGKTILALSGVAGINIKGTGLYDDRAVGANPPNHVVNWTGGLAQGSTSIVLASVSGLSVGKLICLDQVNDNIDVKSSQCGYCGRDGSTRSQQQFVKVKAISGNTVTISSPVYMPNWRTSQSPQAWWQDGTVLEKIGVENLTIDGRNGGVPGDGYAASIFMASAYNCWVQNIESLYGGGVCHINPLAVARCEFRHNSFKHARGHGSMSYGILAFSTSGCWFEDNYFNDVTAPFAGGVGSSGCAISYNYATNSTWVDPNNGSKYNSPLITLHDAHHTMLLVEGNYANTFYADYYHGSSGYSTIFRNRFTGYDAGVANYAWCIALDIVNRSANIVGNVLGTPGWSTVYSSCGSQNIYTFGCFKGGQTGSGDDPLVAATAYLHGNYDVVNRSVLWNATNADHALPASLLYSSKPSWFRDRPWPPFDPNTGAAATANVLALTNLPAGYRYLYGVDAPGGPPSTNPSTTVSTTSLNFALDPNTGSSTQTVTVANIGAGTLTGSCSITSTSSPSPWSLVGPTSYSVTPSTSATIKVRYTPTTSADSYATLTFTDNGGGASVGLSGGRPKTYIWPLGDSLTRGSGYNGANIPGGYRLPLYQMLTNVGVNVGYVGTLSDNPSPNMPYNNHDGTGGYEIGDLAAGFVLDLSFNVPDYILLMVGINDFRHNNDIQHATNRLENLIIELATNAPNAKIIVADLNPWTNLQPTNAAMETFYNPYIPGIVTRQAALGRKVSLCDMRGRLTASDLGADNTHPTQIGYNKIATNWFSVITGSIGNQPPPSPPQNLRVAGP